LQLSDGGAITAGDKFAVLSNPKKTVTYFNKHGLLFEDVEDVQLYAWFKEFSKIIIKQGEKVDQIFLTLQETIHTRLQQQPSGALQNFKEKAWYIQTVKEAESELRSGGMLIGIR
jgi:hypothetical protein